MSYTPVYRIKSTTSVSIGVGLTHDVRCPPAAGIPGIPADRNTRYLLVSVHGTFNLLSNSVCQYIPASLIYKETTFRAQRCVSLSTISLPPENPVCIIPSQPVGSIGIRLITARIWPAEAEEEQGGPMRQCDASHLQCGERQRSPFLRALNQECRY